MKHQRTVNHRRSLLSILLPYVTLTDDIVPRVEPGGLSNLVGGVLITVVWLYGRTGTRATAIGDHINPAPRVALSRWSCLRST
jgi:hypothetical protein